MTKYRVSVTLEANSLSEAVAQFVLDANAEYVLGYKDLEAIEWD